jgi:hypothetical protein
MSQDREIVELVCTKEMLEKVIKLMNTLLMNGGSLVLNHDSANAPDVVLVYRPLGQDVERN